MSKTNMKKCPNCGAIMKEGVLHCPNCGEKIEQPKAKEEGKKEKAKEPIKDEVVKEKTIETPVTTELDIIEGSSNLSPKQVLAIMLLIIFCLSYLPVAIVSLKTCVNYYDKDNDKYSYHSEYNDYDYDGYNSYSSSENKDDGAGVQAPKNLFSLLIDLIILSTVIILIINLFKNKKTKTLYITTYILAAAYLLKSINILYLNLLIAVFLKIGIAIALLITGSFINMFVNEGSSHYNDRMKNQKNFFVAPLIATIFLLIEVVYELYLISDDVIYSTDSNIEISLCWLLISLALICICKWVSGWKSSSYDGYTKITIHLLLGFVTLGIYYIVWVYRTNVIINKLINEKNSPVLQTMCFLFLPFYYLYWVYKTMDTLSQYATSKSVKSNLGYVPFLLSLISFPLASALMQDFINTIVISEKVEK